jgi:predicted acylesterase/phospholipase RssA
MDIKVLEQFLRDNIGEYTFQEAYDKFGVILNITVTGSAQHDQDRLLNYLTAPNVLIWSASAASCAIPLIYGATDLFCKDHEGNNTKYTLMNRKFVDGSIAHDLPMNKLSIFFNVNNFIVSQTNPWYKLINLGLFRSWTIPNSFERLLIPS